MAANDDRGYDGYQLHIPLPAAAEESSFHSGIRARIRRPQLEGPVRTLLLRRRDNSAVRCRVTYAEGNEKDELAARAWIARQDAGWWYRAPWYNGPDGLEIVEA
jgi:hypothetical protein